MIDQPTIKVGVLFADEIGCTFHGVYRLADSDFTFEGNVRIVADKQNARLISGDMLVETVFPLTLEPLNYENASFELHDVTIGVNFHWERKENQRFRGFLSVLEENNLLTAINTLKLEDYLESVISSEMKATASPEFLKAHAVMSRSWLLAQINKAASVKADGSYNSFAVTDSEHIRWYDREDHQSFDVCADDHCQRYQGITRANTTNVTAAVKETAGIVLEYDGKICDARFSKCCGGVTEVFENVWEPVSHQYLSSITDGDTFPDGYDKNLTLEENVRHWIKGSPPAYCNTADADVLGQVLNDYDLETSDFYRWKVVLSQEELQHLLKIKINVDVGPVKDLIPVERGLSGRLMKLKIVGAHRSLIIGKELEIRKALSPSHLYSSAFVVEKGELRNGIPKQFTFFGAGWGHGVGLCQIGAAVMGAKGKTYNEILMHYFSGAKLEGRY